MNLYIDCEFNGYQGELISMALVDATGRHWYESLGCVNPVPWVAENVIPVLNISPPVSRIEMRRSLVRFLSRYESIRVIADWPCDIRYFCELIVAGPGIRVETPPLAMVILHGLDARSTVPHNALEDARALRLAHIASTGGAIAEASAS